MYTGMVPEVVGSNLTALIRIINDLKRNRIDKYVALSGNLIARVAEFFASVSDQPVPSFRGNGNECAGMQGKGAMRGSALNQSDVRCMVSMRVAPHPRVFEAKVPDHEAVIMAHYQERTMEKTQTTLEATTSGLSRLFRFVIFFLTLGFAYPHVWTEGLKVK
jgi:hypothetical protein